MAPTALFDKSFIQSLSLDESVFFDHFFLPVICPLFYVETLADLEKRVRQRRTPEQEVGIIADKVPEMSGGPCAYHVDLATANLIGVNVPMDGRIPTAGGRLVTVDGKVGFTHGVPPEAEAFSRWQKREFLHVERQFARTWRAALNSIDLATIAAAIRAMGITPQTCRSLEDAKLLIDSFLRRDGQVVSDQIKLALIALGVPQYEPRVLAIWRAQGEVPLADFAPYAAHVIGVDLFFQTALGANLIGSADANNRTDIGYFFYTPFCQVFVSSDHLHRRCASHFLRTDQSFVWGPELKADLNRLMNYYAARPKEEKEQGLMRLAPTPPPDDKESLVVQLWDRHLLPLWRNRKTAPQPRNVEQDAKLVEHINRVSSAPSISPTEVVDFKPTDPDFVCIERRIAKRKGSWWQLPKDLKG